MICMFFSLVDWLKTKHLKSDIESMTAQDLNFMLERFYAEARTKDGRVYTRSTLMGIRSSINRYLNACGHNVSILKDSVFSSSNVLLERLYQNEKKRDKGTKKIPISDEDVITMMRSGVFSLANPHTVLRKVWFDLILHFGLKGKEAIRTLTKDSFLLEKDENGREFYRLHFEKEMMKIETFSEMHDWYWFSRMYEIPDDENCPVRSMSLYISKLNAGSVDFFQRPVEKIYNNHVWYQGAMGHNSILRMMTEISEAACLSRIYTNICLKATIEGMLDKHAIDSEYVYNYECKGRYHSSTQTSYEQMENSYKLHEMFYSLQDDNDQ